MTEINEMADFFTFGGESSKDHGLYIRDFPQYTTAKRRVDTKEIPGRNGDYVHDEGTFTNVTGIYDVWFKHRCGLDELHALSLCLLQGKGYQRLEDTFEPEIYRMAVCANALEVETEAGRTGNAEIVFNCKPQRFFRFGDVPIVVSSGQKLHNSYMPSQPKIILSGSGGGTINVGGQAITISQIPADGLVLDCELQDAYSAAQFQNCNPYVSINGNYPVLSRGFTQISWEGDIDEVKIIPRWWTL